MAPLKVVRKACAKPKKNRSRGRGARARLHQRHERVDALPLDRVLHGHDGGLGALLVLRQRALHLGRADAVARHVVDVVHAPCGARAARA